MELIRVQDSDYRKTYELYMTFPENENGYMNSVYGYNYEQFLEWIEKKRNWSLGKELPEGFVPDTTYVLVDAMKIAIMLCGGVCFGVCCFGYIICIMDDNIPRCLSCVTVVVAD